jgi:hypothetical protein
VHPSRAAARAEAATLARERHEALARAVLAATHGEAVGQYAAAQEVFDLVTDVLGQRAGVVPLDVFQKRGKVFVDELPEEGVGRMVADDRLAARRKRARGAPSGRYARAKDSKRMPAGHARNPLSPPCANVAGVAAEPAVSVAAPPSAATAEHASADVSRACTRG